MFPVRSVINISRLLRSAQRVSLPKTRMIEKINHWGIQPRTLHQTTVYGKYNKKASSADDNDSDDDNNDEFKDERDSKIVKTKLNSLRTDLLLKAGLGTARNKIEAIFYDSKIRVNGMKVSKKSEQVSIGDEIDIIRGFSQSNPSHIIVSRVMVLAASDRDEGLMVTLRRYKSLLIENYQGVNAYKSSDNSEHK